MKRLILLYAFFAVIISGFAASPKNAGQLFESARQLDNANRFEDALSLYLKADSAFVAEKLDRTGEYAQSLHNTGRAYLNLNDFENGRQYTLKAALLRESLFGKVSSEYITTLNNYALSYLLTGELPEALKYQTEVIQLCRQMDPPHSDEGAYLINLGRIYHALQDDTEAVKYMEKALPKVEKFGTNYEYILTFLGIVYSDQNDNANINRILRLSDEHNRHELEKECNDPECHLERAELYMSIGEPAKAKEEYSAVFAMPLTDDEKVALYEKYARFLFGQKDFAESGDYYALASGTSNRVNGTTEKSILLLQHAGACYFIGQEYDKSIDAHTEVVDAVEKYGYPEKIKSSSLQGLGNSYSANNDFPNAITCFSQWVRHLKENGHSEEPEYAKAFERLASAEKFNGDYDASIADYETAMSLYEKLGLFDEQEQAKAGLTMCLARKRVHIEDSEDNSEAEKQRENKLRTNLKASIDLLEQGGDYLGKLSKAQTLATIAGTYAMLEDYVNAIKYYSLYIPAVREAIAEDFLLKNPKERELTWLQELSSISAMGELVSRLPQDPYLFGQMSNIIYEGQLLSKGILLSSNIEFDKVLRLHGTKEMQKTYSSIKANLRKIEQMRNEHKPLEDILTLSRKTNDMELALAKDNAAYADFMKYLRITSSDVCDALDDDEMAIEFTTLDTDILSDGDMIAAAVITKEFPTGILMPVSMVKGLRDMIADKTLFSRDEYGETIWGNLLRTFPDKRRIYFAPDGLLNNIGIEYLSVNGRPLSTQYEVSRLSSTRELVREHKKTPLEYASLFGGIDYMEEGKAASEKRGFSKSRTSDGVSFAPLENTKREVDEIKKILKPNTKKTFEYTGTKASKNEFLSQQELPLNLLHIATHGKYIDNGGKSSDSDAMDNSLLAFAGASLYLDYKNNEGVVRASEIADMSLSDCGLVVLSACESGIGKLGGDGVFGLQRGFKNAGVDTLMVSLNVVTDDISADMMISFYRNLFAKPGVTVREAFGRAQSEIREKYPDDNTWASFILIDSFN